MERLRRGWHIKEFRILFGQRLRFLRKREELTQKELAAKAHLNGNYVASIERGERNVSLENIMRLSEALEVFPGELFKFHLSHEE